jgi:hypothetical protein
VDRTDFDAELLFVSAASTTSDWSRSSTPALHLIVLRDARHCLTMSVTLPL